MRDTESEFVDTDAGHRLLIDIEAGLAALAENLRRVLAAPDAR